MPRICVRALLVLSTISLASAVSTNAVITPSLRLHPSSDISKTWIPQLSALEKQCQRGVPDCVRLRGGDDKRSPDLQTRLFRACHKGDIDKAMELVKAGADPNRMSDALDSEQDTQSSNKWSIACSPLQYACCQGHNHVVRALVDAGGDVNKANRKGYTALHYAVLMGKMETCKLLVELGANLCARDSFGDEPVDRAEQAEHHALAKWLEQAMAERGLTRVHEQEDSDASKHLRSELTMLLEDVDDFLSDSWSRVSPSSPAPQRKGAKAKAGGGGEGGGGGGREAEGDEQQWEKVAEEGAKWSVERDKKEGGAKGEKEENVEESKCQLLLEWPDDAQKLEKVEVAGSWDNWVGRTQLKRNEHGVWSVKVNIPRPETGAEWIDFKFILNGVTWLVNERYASHAPDSNEMERNNRVQIHSQGKWVSPVFTDGQGSRVVKPPSRIPSPEPAHEEKSLVEQLKRRVTAIRAQASASPSPSSPRGRLLLKLQGRVKDLEVSLKQRTARMDQLSRAASPGSEEWRTPGPSPAWMGPALQVLGMGARTQTGRGRGRGWRRRRGRGRRRRRERRRRERERRSRGGGRRRSGRQRSCEQR